MPINNAGSGMVNQAQKFREANKAKIQALQNLGRQKLQSSVDTARDTARKGYEASMAQAKQGKESWAGDRMLKGGKKAFDAASERAKQAGSGVSGVAEQLARMGGSRRDAALLGGAAFRGVDTSRGFMDAYDPAKVAETRERAIADQERQAKIQADKDAAEAQRIRGEQQIARQAQQRRAQKEAVGNFMRNRGSAFGGTWQKPEPEEKKRKRTKSRGHGDALRENIKGVFEAPRRVIGNPLRG